MKTSNCLPYVYADTLIEAAKERDIAKIDRITDELAKYYPHLVLPRGTMRPEFLPK